jgi:RimJ/RimL family protein N-acetyltransferase
MIETARLALRQLTTDDAAFILELVNDPAWIAFIGDRGVHNLDDAGAYISTGPMAMYTALGFGLYLVELKATGAPIGMCGLIKRDFLEDVDIGFAFLARYRGHGYAFEAATATMAYAADALGHERVVAIVAQENHRSAKLLEKLGFHFERMMQYPGETEELRLFACQIKRADV